MSTNPSWMMEELLASYRLLDLAPGAEEGVVRAAFKAKSKRHHPDTGGSHEAFLQIEAAFEAIAHAAFPDVCEFASAQRPSTASDAYHAQSESGGAEDTQVVHPSSPRHAALVRPGPPRSLLRGWTLGEQWSFSLETDLDTSFQWVLSVMSRAASCGSAIRRIAVGGLGVQIQSQDPNRTWIRFKLREGIDAGWLDVDLDEACSEETLTQWTLWMPRAEAQARVNVNKTQARIAVAMSESWEELMRQN